MKSVRHGFTRLVWSVAVVLAGGGAGGCVDQDPLGLAERKVDGAYRLERFEGGLYYLQKKGVDRGGGGVLDGVVEEIGWESGYIYVRRRPLAGTDAPGWMIIETRSGAVSGPLTDHEFRAKYPNVATWPAADAWQKL